MLFNHISFSLIHQAICLESGFSNSKLLNKLNFELNLDQPQGSFGNNRTQRWLHKQTTSWDQGARRRWLVQQEYYSYWWSVSSVLRTLIHPSTLPPCTCTYPVLFKRPCCMHKNTYSIKYADFPHKYSINGGMKWQNVGQWWRRGDMTAIGTINKSRAVQNEM